MTAFYLTLGGLALFSFAWAIFALVISLRDRNDRP